MIDVSLGRRWRAVTRRATMAKSEFLPLGGGDALRQFLILFGCYVVYDLARALARGRDEVALANGRAVMNLEKALHVYVEPWIQAKVSHVGALVTFFNFFYINAHLTVMIGVLLWLYVKRNEYYLFCRNWFLLMNGLAVTAFALVPTAPPRLLPTSGMVDTMYLFSSSNLRGGTMGWLANPYAAVPSLHFGYALFASLVVYFLARGVWPRRLAVAYPFVVLLSIVGTGNHFLFDALGGALVAIAAYLLTLKFSLEPADEPLLVLNRGRAAGR